jgi:hypothetical protein
VDLTAINIEEHMGAFQDFIDKIFLERDNVFMRLFIWIMEGDIRKWFRGLPSTSIGTWKSIKLAFMRQWGEKRDRIYYLTEFGSSNKKANENVVDFIRRFNNIYNNIPIDMKPSQ